MSDEIELSWNEKRRKKSLEKAKKRIEENEGTILWVKHENKKTYIQIRCKNNHEWITTAYKLNETDWDWCKKCYHIERGKKERLETYKKTEEYLSTLDSCLVEKTYDYKKQKFHIYCNKHIGFWNEVGYEATRLFREKLICPVCKRILLDEEKQKALEIFRKEKDLERQKKKEFLQQQREEKVKEIKLLKEAEKCKKEQIPPCPEGMDSFVHFSKYEEVKVKKNGSQSITLLRAKKKLEDLGCLDLVAISLREISYMCECGEKYKKSKQKIMHKNFSKCNLCAKKKASEKSHKSKMDKYYKEMCNAAKEQGINVISKELINAKTGIKCKKENGKEFCMTYRQFKRRYGIIDPDFNKGGTSIPEIICREIIEQLTGCGFSKGFPEGWFYYTKKGQQRTFSVDMYNKDDFNVPIAFEYWGEEIHIRQKESSTKYSKEKFKRTQENDKKKSEYAKETGTKLIILKGYDTGVGLNKIVEDIKKILKENNIPFDVDKTVNISTDVFEFLIKKVKNYCENQNGTLLSTEILNMNSKIEVKCNIHDCVFQTTPSELLNSHHWNCEHCIKLKQRKRLGITPEKIAKRLEKIPYPQKISFIDFVNEPSCHKDAYWYCSEHGKFTKRVDSVIYINYNKYHGCPVCESKYGVVYCDS